MEEKEANLMWDDWVYWQSAAQFCSKLKGFQFTKWNVAKCEQSCLDTWREKSLNLAFSIQCSSDAWLNFK